MINNLIVLVVEIAGLALAVTIVHLTWVGVRETVKANKGKEWR